MQSKFNFMPIDRTEIKTRLRLHPDLLDAPTDFIREHNLPIRTVKNWMGKSSEGPTRKMSLGISTHKGINLELSQVTGKSMIDVTINFNPGVCLFGQNGNVLSPEEFLHALAILANNIKPLLYDQADWVDIIPGLRSRNVAYWSYLEIFLHYPDPDGHRLAGFRNAQLKTTRTPIRHWTDSIKIGGKKSNRQFGIYRKAVEMEAREKLEPEKLTEYEHVLRLEVRLTKEKIVEHLNSNRSLEMIDGEMRLVRFYPEDLFHGIRNSFATLQGFYRPSKTDVLKKANGQNTHLGRLLARVANDPSSSSTLQDLLVLIKYYTDASTDTMGSIRKAGIAELIRLSLISYDELFSYDSFQTQQSVWSEKKKVFHEFENMHIPPLILEAYRPPNHTFLPMVEFPTYVRV